MAVAPTAAYHQLKKMPLNPSAHLRFFMAILKKTVHFAEDAVFLWRIALTGVEYVP
jgi:hypothetical protein